MTTSQASATYRVRIADSGAATVAGNVAATLTQADDLAEIPTLSGPSVDVLACSSTSHPFRLRCISDKPLFTSSGRMVTLGRLAEVQRDVGSGFVTIGTGRLSHLSETERGLVDVEVSDERWVERQTEIFRTTTSVQLAPVGLSAAWRDKPAAGTMFWTVREVDGSAVRLSPGNLVLAPVFIPAALAEALTEDLVTTQRDSSATNSAGNFSALRFDDGTADRTVISFRKSFTGVSLNSETQSGLLGSIAPGGNGLLHDVWIYHSGHTYNVNDTISAGKLYFPSSGSGIRVGEQIPVHVGGTDGIHPMQLLQDILDGDYGGDAVLYDSGAMTTLKALSMRPVWLRATDPAQRDKWLAANIYRVYAVLAAVGTDLTARPTSLLQPQDEDPTGMLVLDADNSELPTYEHTSRELRTVLDFTSRRLWPIAQEVNRPETWSPDGYEARERRQTEEHDNVATIGAVVHTVKTELIFGIHVFEHIKELAAATFDVFGDGPQTGEIRVADDAGNRDGQTEPQIGDHVVLDHDTLKGFNPETDDRTGKRVVQLVAFRDFSPDGITFRYLDKGPNSQPLDDPTVAVAEASDPDYLEVTISNLNAGEKAVVEVEIASSQPTTFSLSRAGVVNETVSFFVGHDGSTTGYARAKTTMPGRISSDWVQDTVALSARAKITEASVAKSRTFATVEWTVPASGTAGMRTRYSIHERNEDPTFGNQADFDSDDGGFTISGVPSRSMVSVELTPYPGFSGGSVSGTPGDVVIVEAIFPRVEPGGPPIIREPRVPTRTTINDSSEAVVFVSAPEEAVAVYVTVGDGSSPSDPTSAANDGEIVGPTGVSETGVTITPGNDAYVKAVWEDAHGVVSLVSEERSTWNDVFAGEQITGSNPVFTGQVDVEAGEGNVALRFFSTSGGHIAFFDTAGVQQGVLGYTETGDIFLADIDVDVDVDIEGDVDLDATGTVDLDGSSITLRAGGNVRGQFTDPGGADNTSLIIVIDNGSVVARRVEIGAADSGGSGFRMLRVPN